MYLLLANATQVNSDFRARWLAGSEENSKDYSLPSSRWDKVTCQEFIFFGICAVYSKTMIHLNVVVSESNLLLDSNICTEQLFEKVESLLQMQMIHLFFESDPALRHSEIFWRSAVLTFKYL